MPQNGNHVNPQTGEIARQDFGGHEIARSAETAVSAAAAQAKAQVEAMYIMALNRPRDMIAVRDRLLNECERRGFAESARYTIKRGGKSISGPSVRFAEAALRALGNIHVKTTILYDDAERRVGEVTAIDLESNVPLSAGFSIDKTIERKKLYGGETIVGERTNSQGEQVYRILGTEADIQQKQESAVARIRRNLILQLLPGDIKDEAITQCDTTLRREDAADPKAAAKKLADAFHAIGISPAQLREYLGHNVDQVTPDEAAELRGFYFALRDGETKWADVLEGRHSEKPEPPTQEEMDERKRMIQYLANVRIKDREIYEAALQDMGVAMDIQASKLPTETLKKLVDHLEGAPIDPPAETEGGAP